MPLTMQVEDPSVAGARSGDPLAWADLAERFHPLLARYLEVVDPDSAADMASVWNRAGRSLGGQPEGVDPWIWLLRVARDGRVICPPPDQTDDPVIRAIRMLAPFEMDVVALRVVAGLDDHDTALVVGRPVERVRRACHDGLVRLAGLLT